MHTRLLIILVGIQGLLFRLKSARIKTVNFAEKLGGKSK
jgi:hypothetical protein